MKTIIGIDFATLSASSRKLQWVPLMLGFAAIMLLGCSDRGSSPASANSTNRIHLMTSEYGTLSLIDRNNGYKLTLDNVSEDMLWFADRPDHESGTETTTEFINSEWPSVYGEVAPNAVLDGYKLPNDSKDIFFLVLQEPQYDSGSHRLIFYVTLIDSTLDDNPEDLVNLEEVKITILNNYDVDDSYELSFLQVGQEAYFEPAGTDGRYTLRIHDVHKHLYYYSNAPHRYMHIHPVESFVQDWQARFKGTPPNASLTAHSDDGKLIICILTLEHPVYDEGASTVTYAATLMHGDINESSPLYFPTIYIDSSTGERFTDNQDGTVTDNNTNLMWCKNTNPCGRKNWSEAMSHCANSTLAGHSDWYLASIQELGAMNYKMPFSNFQLAGYWSSTVLAGDHDYAYFVVYCSDGFTDSHRYDAKYRHYPVWCVRDIP